MHTSKNDALGSFASCLSWRILATKKPKLINRRGVGVSKTRLAINGFGRIGRNAFKIAWDRDDIEVVAINDLTDKETLAHLLKYDSVYGQYAKEVALDDTGIVIDGVHIDVLTEGEPANLPWLEKEIDVVIEATGVFANHERASAHIEAGAARVVVSAPIHSDDANVIVIGVNEESLTNESAVISNASCTTNCVAPVLSILHEAFGVDKSMMTTVHSYTANQRLTDAPANNLREARAAAENIVPTTTNADNAVGHVLPEMADRFAAMSVRVPTAVVSLCDLVAVLNREVTVDEINEVFRRAAADSFYQGIVAVSEAELVSSDFKGNSHSAIIDLPLTQVTGGTMVKVVAWYDNEWAYSNRLIELAADVGRAQKNR